MAKQRMSLHKFDELMSAGTHGNAGWLGDGPNEYRAYFTPTKGWPQRRIFIGVRAHSEADARVIFDWTASWLGANQPTSALHRIPMMPAIRLPT